ncbi:iduronate 2-sulfatase isoform X2 [Phymastichus coffea]|nr:iduronate 2-sulfatase isoform X2 [Phymastichus coffea]
MPQHLKNHGYRTASFGKVFHPGASCNGNDDSPYSWTEPAFHPYTQIYKDAPVCPSGSVRLASNLVCPVRVKSMPNATLPDIETLQAAKAFLRTVAREEKPFFLSIGFHKPHVPLKYPKRYLKHHPRRKHHLPTNYQWPNNLTHLAYNPWMDLRLRDDVRKLALSCPWQKIPGRYARKIIQSYYAAVTYIDNLVGKLLYELELRALRNNTIVILTSDHGWSLGEHSEWAKYSNFEVALRVPLLISVPGFSSARVREPVELLDIFPTVAELAGFPVSICPRQRPPNLCSQGSSLLPLFRSSDRSQPLSDWKGIAISLYPRLDMEPVCEPDGDKPSLRHIRIMGYSIRTMNYRYTVWLPFSWRTNRPEWTKLLAEELYDHNLDVREMYNVAASADHQLQKQHLKNRLMNSLR